MPVRDNRNVTICYEADCTSCADICPDVLNCRFRSTWPQTSVFAGANSRSKRAARVVSAPISADVHRVKVQATKSVPILALAVPYHCCCQGTLSHQEGGLMADDLILQALSLLGIAK